jgi:large conductance mechanosensitive channel
MLEGFKNFLMRGNVVDLAVGVIIGAAFGAVVDSIVKDVITPIIGMIGGQPDFSAICLGTVSVVKGANVCAGIGIGNFINALISFVIKAAAVYFIVVVPMNAAMARMKKPEAPAAPAGPTQEELLVQIRDLLKK